ncbi:MAG: hypothetical protein HY067_20900 [Betaproteobacteria bacterium]|nr:hypothetical protein [Betaproteobacteria bacterium]
MIISILQQLRMLIVSVALAASLPVLAQQMSRQVIVNGAVMNRAQLMVLDALNCGSSVPDGRYWLNTQTGAWGYQGGGQEGVIGEDCSGSQVQPGGDVEKGECERKYRLHEDRMCYCYHVC